MHGAVARIQTTGMPPQMTEPHRAQSVPGTKGTNPYPSVSQGLQGPGSLPSGGLSGFRVTAVQRHHRGGIREAPISGGEPPQSCGGMGLGTKGRPTEGMHGSGGAKPESSPAGEIAGLADHRLPRGSGYRDKITLFRLGMRRLVSRRMGPWKDRRGCAGGLGRWTT